MDPNELKALKKSLRNDTLAKREAFSKNEEEHQKASQKIMDRLKSSPEYQQAHTIMCFVSYSDEVITHDFIKDALKEEKKVFVPHILRPEKVMVPAEIIDFDKDLAPGYFNILSPREDEVRIKDAKEIDLVVTPGVLFDAKGYRIGYGGGFYDRFFQHLDKKVPRIAIAFELQKSDQDLPRDAFDEAVDALITETNRQDFTTGEK